MKKGRRAVQCSQTQQRSQKRREPRTPTVLNLTAACTLKPNTVLRAHVAVAVFPDGRDSHGIGEGRLSVVHMVKVVAHYHRLWVLTCVLCREVHIMLWMLVLAIIAVSGEDSRGGKTSTMMMTIVKEMVMVVMKTRRCIMSSHQDIRLMLASRGRSITKG